MTCGSTCPSGNAFVSQSGLKYCKEYDGTLTWIDNSASTPCT
jgi:hypothetical protein